MQPAIGHRLSCARFSQLSILLLLSCFGTASADPVGDYQGWLWETGIFTGLGFNEEYCFAQINVTFAVDQNWTSALTDDVCWGRVTIIAGRGFVNAPPFTTFSDEPDQSTRPMVGAGGNLYEFYGEEFENQIGQGEERFGALLSTPSNDNLLILGGFDGFSDQTGEEYFRFIYMAAKSTSAIRDARTAADLAGTNWRIAMMEHTLDDSDVNSEIAASTILTLELQAAGVCSYSVSGIFPDFVANADAYFALQFDDGINFDDRFVNGGIDSATFTNCTYTIDANKYLSITRTETLASDPGNPFIETDRFVVSDDNRHLLAAPAPVVEDSPRTFTLGYRAASQLAIGAIDSTYLFHLTISEFGADGAGAAAAGFGSRDWQELDQIGRGKIVFDSTTVSTTPAGESGTWYSCDMELVISDNEHEFTGSTTTISVTLGELSTETGNVQLDECDFQLGIEGDLSIRLFEADEEDPADDFDAILRGYVNDNGELMSLTYNGLGGGIGSNLDLANIFFLLGMQYTGDPGADADGDGFTNYEEFKIPLPELGVPGDLDGDGSADILWRNGTSGENWLYLMNGATIASSVDINTVPAPWEIVGNGDYNGDGSADILWRNSSTGQNWMYLMNGNLIASSVGVNTVPTDWEVAGNGDYNGDGKSDILWRHSGVGGDGQNWMYLMNGNLITSSMVVVWDSVFTIPLVWEVAGNGDYNGDNNADILWRNSSTGENWIYFMNGVVVTGSVRVNAVPAPWEIVGNGDYNGDGSADILWRNSSTGQNWMYLMTGATIASSVGVNTVPLDWEVAGNGDYNGDGKSDILWRHSGFGGVGGDGQNWLYLMNAATISSSVEVNTVPTDWQIVNVD